MNIDTVKAQENLDEPEKAFELDNVAVRLVRSREPLVSDEPFSNPDSVVRALSEHTYHSAYADIGMVLDNYTTDELIEYLKNNEPGGESSLRNYVESQIIGAQINRERYQSENNIVTESVTKDMPDEPDIKQVAGMRI